MDFNKIYKMMVAESVKAKDPKVFLKELMQFDNFLYSKISQVAVNYGNGIHPKHRVTKYHDFFVNNINDNESVLDLGSGRGDVTYDIAKKTKGRVVGLEINDNNISYATKIYKYSNLSFIKADICRNIPREHFDTIVMSNVLEHLKNRVDLLRTIASKTTPSKFLFRIPHFEREWIVPVKKELGVNYFLDSTHEIEYTHQEFEDEIGQANLEIKKIQVNWGEIWAVCIPKNV